MPQKAQIVIYADLKTQVIVDLETSSVKNCLLNIYGRGLQCQHFGKSTGKTVTLSQL